MSLINIEVATNALGLEKPAHALVKAISKGIGAALYPWQKARETRADLGAFSAWRSELAKIEIGSAQLDLGLADRTELRLRLDSERFQSNREAIAKEGIKAFKALTADHRLENPPEIEDEWLDQFWRHAETIAADDLRSLWGRVLARQAAGSTRVSARTLSFLSTLSRQEAYWIEAVARVAIGCMEGHRRAFSVINSMSYFGDNGSFQQRDGSDDAHKAEPVLAILTETAQWGDLDSIGVLSQTGWAYEALLPISNNGAHLTIGGKNYIIKNGLKRVEDHLASGQLRLGSGMKFSSLGSELLAIVDVQPNPELFPPLIVLWKASA